MEKVIQRCSCVLGLILLFVMTVVSPASATTENLNIETGVYASWTEGTPGEIEAAVGVTPTSGFLGVRCTASKLFELYVEVNGTKVIKLEDGEQKAAIHENVTIPVPSGAKMKWKIKTGTPTCEYSFSTATVNTIEGKEGKEGKPGIEGKEGKPGIEGKEGKEGKEGSGFDDTAMITAQNNTSEMVEVIGFCIIGTLLALALTFMVYRILRVDPR